MYLDTDIVIPLRDKSRNVVGSTIVSSEDRPLVGRRCCRSGYGYATTYINGKVRLVHIAILGKRPGHYIDHIDRNPLNNRRANLRHVTPAVSSANTSGLCVEYNKKTGRWFARVMKNGVRHKVGTFATKEEAMEAVRRKKIELHPELPRDFKLTN